jgi:hypothetical protein
MHAVKIARRGGIMKKLIVVAFVALLWSATAEAQSCAKCYSSLEGTNFCGLNTHNGAQTCEATMDYICTLKGSCIGVDGEACKRRPCPQEKWVDATLPEKSRWVVASVTIEKPRKTS